MVPSGQDVVISRGQLSSARDLQHGAVGLSLAAMYALISGLNMTSLL